MNQQATLQRIFSQQDQFAFANWSGDHNPIHVDSIAVRRTGARDLVVHGVHSLLWCVDTISDARGEWDSLTAVKVNFDSFVVIGDVVEVMIVSETSERWRIEARVRDLLVMTIVLLFGERKTGNVPPLPISVRDSNVAIDLPTNELLNYEGQVRFCRSDQPTSFPGAERMLGISRVQALGATTRIVGMECPGLNSVFNKIDLYLSDESAPNSVGFSVAQHNLEHRRVVISVWGGGWVGSLTASVRQKPTVQPKIEALRALVPTNAFASMAALVVGGSRGIGEVSAKLIAAGGGTVIITYAKSDREAERVVAEIVAGGGKAQSILLDITIPLEPQISLISEQVNTLLYFATPPIGTKKSKMFDDKTLNTFLSFYVTRFYDLVKLVKVRGKRLTLYYPSTVYIEERPAGLTEYAMAKGAGEQLCSDLMKVDPEIKIVIDRLPRLATDQNPGFDGDSIGEVVIRGLLQLAST